jgi:molybdopterin adenylyltransferase
VNSEKPNQPALARNRAHVITVSDGAFHGSRQDTSGAVLIERLKGSFEVSGPEVVPDEGDRIAAAIAAAAGAGNHLVVTTGGTGLGPRDVTPQATESVIDYAVPGVAELMRQVGMKSTPMAALSRGVVGVRGRTLVINVPGSPKGAVESIDAVLPVLDHALRLLQGDTEHR